MPAKKVASKRANAGARSAEAMEKTRNQAISNPSAMNPESPAKNMAIGSLIGESVGACCADSAGRSVDSFAGRRPYMYAVPPTIVLRQAAIETEPDWPNSRSKNVAQI